MSPCRKLLASAESDPRHGTYHYYDKEAAEVLVIGFRYDGRDYRTTRWDFGKPPLEVPPP
ncbi:MAG TPA: hypothetical protein VG055_04435 [Planctomycetaceae bacterium]|nr:hypothetical protein [Planctomycetaceae bacterium]